MTIYYDTSVNFDLLQRRMIEAVEGMDTQPNNIGDGTITYGHGYTFLRGGEKYVTLKDDLGAIGIALTENQKSLLDTVVSEYAKDKAAGNTTTWPLTSTAITNFKNAWTAPALSSDDAYKLFKADAVHFSARIKTIFKNKLGGDQAKADTLYNALQGTREWAAILCMGYVAESLIGTSFVNALADRNRAEAWFQMRYGWEDNNPKYNNGWAARHYLESTVFGLYNNRDDVKPEEATQIYAMLTKNRAKILEREGKYGFLPTGVSGTRDMINQDANAANNKADYLATLTAANVGSVPTLIEALTPARNAFITWVNSQLPSAAKQLVAADWNPAAIYYQGSDSSGDDGHFNPTLDARSLDGKGNGMDKNLMVGGSSTSGNIMYGGTGNDYLLGNAKADILEGDKGDDTLIGGAGEDTYIWNTGDGNDTIVDADGGRLVINGETYKFSGGAMIKDGSSNVWKDASGNVKLTHNSPWRLELADSSVIELGADFDPAKWNINLEESSTATNTAPQTTRTILGDKRPTSFFGTFDGQLTGFDLVQWRLVRSFNQVTDEDGKIITQEVEYYKTDDIGNLLVDDAAEPGRTDSLKDSAGNDRIESGGGDDKDVLVGGGSRPFGRVSVWPSSSGKNFYGMHLE